MTKIIMFEDFVPEKRPCILFMGLDGRAYQDERAARYASATHTRCGCGEPTAKPYTACKSCREKIAIEKYAKLPTRKWKGEPLYSQAIDHYFFDDELEYCMVDEKVNNEEFNVKDLRFVFCEPESLPQIQIENWDLHEDYEVAPEVKAAVNALNELLAKQPPRCWYPGKVAAIIK